MVKLILFLICLFLTCFCLKNKIRIKFKSFFRKGFKIIIDTYGCYCFTGKQRLSARLIL